MALPPVTKGWRSDHPAIDYGAPSGTELRAPFGGVADVKQVVGSYGLHVRVKGAGTEILLAHLSRTAVVSGMRVDEGALIAWSGGRKGEPTSGKSTGPHVHMEARIDGKLTSPAPWAPGVFAPVSAGRRNKPTGAPQGTGAPEDRNCAAKLYGELSRMGNPQKIPYPDLVGLCSRHPAADGWKLTIGQDGSVVVHTPPTSRLDAIGDTLGKLTSGSTWVRVAQVLGGAVLGFYALRIIGREIESPGLANIGSGLKKAAGAVVPIAKG